MSCLPKVRGLILCTAHVLRRYEAAERRKPATGFFGIIENFTMPDAEGYGGDRNGDYLIAKQMRSLQKEQRKFLRAALAASDPIRYS